MPRFFVPPIHGENTLIIGEDADHILKSLRMRIGEKLTLCDGQFEYGAEFTAAERGQVRVKILYRQPISTELPVKLTLFQAMPKSDKLELIIQKAVELGVGEIVPVLTERVVSRPTEKDFSKKLERLGKISLEAAKQSGRGMIPPVQPMIGYEQCFSYGCDTILFFYENSVTPIRQLLPRLMGARHIGVLIGAEGGFSQKEADLAEMRGARIVSLGKRILRCETAAIAALAVVGSMW